MATDLTCFNIAAIGASDVQDDLLGIKSIIDELHTEYEPRHITFHFYHWTSIPPGAGSPQQYIDSTIDWANMDYVIGAMWQKYGSSLESGMSGTEHEVNAILKLFETYSEPDLLFYFKEPTSHGLTTCDKDIVKINIFRTSLQKKALVNIYSNIEDLKQRVKKALRNKIESKLLRDQQPIKRKGVALPSNRRITVELIISSQLYGDKYTPVILLFKNPNGEEFVFDTRYSDPQSLANWIAKSMGLTVDENISINDILIPAFFNSIKKDTGVIQLWLGGIIISDSKELKTKSVNVALGKTYILDKEKNKIRFDPDNIPTSIQYPPPIIKRDANGQTELAF